MGKISELTKNKIEHLKMIEEIIKRMASNSFYLKGWSVSLISAILVFVKLEANICFIWIALLPTVVFWYLDAFYLQLERKYKKLYKEVQNDYNNGTDNVVLFDMDTTKFKVDNVLQIMWSKSIKPIYLTISIIIALVFCIVKNCFNG